MNENSENNMERYGNFGGYRLNYTLEEEIILEKIKLLDGIISKKNLSDAEQYLCSVMTSKGLLNRIIDNNKTYYVINTDDNNNE